MGYAGAERLFTHLKSRFLNVQRKDVYAVLRRFKSRLLGRAPEANPMLQPRVLGRVMEEVQIDLIDMSGQQKRLPHEDKARLSELAKKNDGWRYILTAQDTFSKFLLVCANLRSKSPAVIAALLHEAWCQYGPPETLLSDREFDVAPVKLMCLRWGV